MKIGGILGTIGGFIALIFGAFGYSSFATLGDIASSVGNEAGAQEMSLYQVASILFPFAGLAGGASCFVKPRESGLALFGGPKESAFLMAFSSVGMLWAFGFNAFSIVPAILLGLGALLVFNDLPDNQVAHRQRQNSMTTAAQEKTIKFDEHGVARHRGTVIQRSGDKYSVKNKMFESLEEATTFIERDAAAALKQISSRNTNEL